MNARTLTVVLVACGAIIHLFLRVYGINILSFDIDESFTWSFSQTLLSAFVDVVFDVHPPAYFAFISLVRKLLGDSETAMRLPSAIFSLLTLGVLLLFTRAEKTNHRISLLVVVSVIFSFLTYEIYLARYARSFSMLVFLIAAFTYCMFMVGLFDDRRYRIPACLFGILAVYTSHLAIPCIFATLVAVVLARRIRQTLVHALTVGLILFVAYIPWLLVLPIHFVVEAQLQARYFPGVGDIATFLDLLNPYSHGFSRLKPPPGPLDMLGLALSTASFAMVAFHAKLHWKSPLVRALFLQFVLLAAILIASPVPLFNSKSLCVLVPGAVLLLAGALVESCFPARPVLTIAFLAVFVLTSVANFPYRRVSTDWRSAFQAIQALLTKAESPALVLSPARDLLTLQYYFSRGVIKDPPPIWVDLKQIAVLLSPWQEKLRVTFLNDKGYVLKNGRKIYSRSSYWWMVCDIFGSDTGISDIFFLRRGAGNLVPSDIVPQPGVPIAFVKRFGLVTLYRIPRTSRTWCTLFDGDYYIRQKPEVAQLGAAPLTHFLRFGYYGDLKPHPLFDTSFYIAVNPDVAKARLNPLAHFLTKGSQEGRKPNPFFDPAYYVGTYPEVAESGLNPLFHYVTRGAKEGKNPHPLFDTKYYLRTNQELAGSSINPLVHFLETGRKEGKKPNPNWAPRTTQGSTNDNRQ
jgi:Dolichyl-phosphate-mannose-protein mannosyltransferase